ncbi:MAG: zinc-binding dehydrogenase [Deltaproteobacteria bacterium]|nr:zinc-binding dehydrogenase [Deltaproteobacteria bacterium]
MKAAVYRGPRDVQVEEVEKPVLRKPGDILINIKACGICGSDLHTYKHGLFIDLGAPMGTGRVMGHEWSGEVAEINGQLPGLKVGDRITGVYGGGSVEYLRIPAGFVPMLRKIPEGVSYEAAATTEPLATSVHSVRLAGPADGQTMVVIGAGIVGLGALQVLKANNSVRVIVADLSDKRLAMAKQMGADIVINSGQEDPVQAVLKIVGELPRMRFLEESFGRVDAAIDWAGVTMESAGGSTLQQALTMVKPNGTVVLGAVSEKSFPMDFNRIMFKGLRVYGSWGWTPSDFDEALQLIGAGKIKRDPLVSHQFDISQAKEAYEMAANTREAIKVLIKP